MKLIFTDKIGLSKRPPNGFAELFGVDYFMRFLINVNNYCNLHCEHCSSLCDKSMLPESPYPFRREIYDMPLEEITDFCNAFKNIGKRDLHRITGGEPTAMPTKHLEDIIDEFYRNKRRTWLLTNGFNLMDLSEESINKLDKITLDDHGINHEHLEDCLNFLRGFYKGDVHWIDFSIHYNLEEARANLDNMGCDCNLIMRTPVLYKRVIYPCCNTHYLESWDKNTRITESLKEAGWTLDNPNVLDALREWRTTLPKYVIKQCLNRCWQPNINLGTPVRITLKSNDVIGGKRRDEKE